MEEERPRHNPDQVLHLVRGHLSQPRRSSGQDLQGRLGARIAWRHRDWTGPAHQDDTGNFCTVFLRPLAIMNRMFLGRRWRVRRWELTTGAFTSSRRQPTKCQTLRPRRLALLPTWKDIHPEELEICMHKCTSPLSQPMAIYQWQFGRS